MQNLVIMVSNPLLVVRELGEALFELLKFTDVFGGVRCLDQFDIFGRFGAILLGGHGKPFCEKRQHILKPRAHTVQSCSLQGDKGRLMGFRDYLKSFLGSETLKAPPERHLDADSEAGLSASLVTLVAGAKGWISTEEARRLFSPVHDPQYAFGELDSIAHK